MVKIILILALVAWSFLGDPPNDIANSIWSHSNAPWEQVDGYFYANKDSDTITKQVKKVGSYADCKDWARKHAKALGDSDMQKVTYKCGIGMVKKPDGSEAYRLLIQ